MSYLSTNNAQASNNKTQLQKSPPTNSAVSQQNKNRTKAKTTYQQPSQNSKIGTNQMQQQIRQSGGTSRQGVVANQLTQSSNQKEEEFSTPQQLNEEDKQNINLKNQSKSESKTNKSSINKLQESQNSNKQIQEYNQQQSLLKRPTKLGQSPIQNQSLIGTKNTENLTRNSESKSEDKQQMKYVSVESAKTQKQTTQKSNMKPPTASNLEKSKFDMTQSLLPQQQKKSVSQYHPVQEDDNGLIQKSESEVQYEKMVKQQPILATPSNKSTSTKIVPQQSQSQQQQRKVLNETPIATNKATNLDTKNYNSNQKVINEVQRTQTEDMDDFNDDMLDDSMELKETNSKMLSSILSPGQNNSNKKEETKDNGNQSNKVYQTTPSKLNTKFSENSKPPGLLDLNLSMNNLTQLLPEHLKNLNLKSLDLRNNKLQELPDSLFELIYLNKLHLDQNQIKVIPIIINNLKDLKFLTISSNFITEIPDSTFELQNLEKLDVSSNKIKQVSFEIWKLQKLKYLFLQDNLITEIPIFVSQIKTLVHFGLDWFSYLRPNFEKILKKPETLLKSQTNNQKKDSTCFDQVFQILQKLNMSLSGEIEQQQKSKISFLEFLMHFYKAENQMDMFNSLFVYKQTTVIHLICKYNHSYLFDSLRNFKDSIDINLFNENGETPLMVALNEKSVDIVERILREYKDQLEFEDSLYHQLDHQESKQELTQNSMSQNLKTSKLQSSPTKQQQLSQHPLLIAIKKQMLNEASKILSLIIRRQQKLMNQNSDQFPLIDLNFRDENKNTILHHLFQFFSHNMELSVEICQELLKYNESSQTFIQALVQTSGQKSLLRELQVLKLNMMNKSGQTPIDLAIEVKQNQALEFAIYYNKHLLPAFANQLCDESVRPKFDLNCNKNIRGLTPIHRAIMVQNYKAIFLLLSSGECDLFAKDKEFKTARDYCQKVLFLAKYLRKGEANFLRKHLIENKAFPLRMISTHIVLAPDLMKKMQKFEQLFHKQVNHNNINMFQLSQKTNRIKYNSWYTRLEQRNMLIQSQQPTIEQQREEEEPIVDVEMQETHGLDEDIDDDIHDIIDENEEGKFGQLHTKDVIKGATLNKESVSSANVKGSSTLQSSEKQKQGDKQIFSFVSATVEKKGDLKLSAVNSLKSKNSSLKKDSLLNPKSNIKESENIKKNSFIKQNQNTRNIQKNLEPNSNNTQSKEQDNMLRKSQMAPMSLGVDDFDKSMQQSILEESKLYANGEEGDFSDHEEDANAESSLYQKNQYIMVANSSKMARKPYYKQLQKNKYERDFLLLLDQNLPYWQKVKYLYQFFSKVQQDNLHNENNNYGLGIGDMKDARDICKFLKYECEQNENSISHLRLEIDYFQEKLQQSQFEIPLSQQQTNKKQQMNVERSGQLPLPSIQEYQNKTGTRSLIKKQSGGGTAQEIQTRTRGSSNYNSQNNNNKQEVIQTQQQTKQLSSSQKKDEIKEKLANNIKMDQKLASNNSQKSLENLTLQKEQINANNNSKMFSTTQYTSSIVKDNTSIKNSSSQQQKQQQQSLLKTANNAGSRNMSLEHELLKESKSENKHPTSPKQSSKKILTSTEEGIGTIQSLSSVQSQRNSMPQKIGTTKTSAKDMCVKKIEVKLNTQNKMESKQQDNGQKWKQLTINPNAPAQKSLTQVQGIQKVSKQSLVQPTNNLSNTNTNSKLSTPSSQKGTPSNQNIIVGAVGSINSQNSSGLQSMKHKQNTSSGQSQIPGLQKNSTQIGSVSSTQATTNLLNSNRSNSNPRNSILSSSSSLKKQTYQQQSTNSAAVKKLVDSNINEEQKLQDLQVQNITLAKEELGSKVKATGIPSLQSKQLESTSKTSQVKNTITGTSGIQSKLKGPTKVTSKGSNFHK